jgi:sugar/nucleoside kinase (ribokinase family)
MLDCMVVGDANVDLLAKTDEDLEPGTEKLASNIELVLGGSSTITAFILAKLGVKVGFVGIVGKDTFGDFVADRLVSAGVSIAYLQRHKTRRTGATIWLSKKAQRSGLTYPGTIDLLRASDIKEDWLRETRHVHVGAYFLLKGLHKPAGALFRKARGLGLTTSLDCNYDPSGKWNSGIEEMLRYTDIFFPNKAEAYAISGAKTHDAAAKRLGTLAGTVAIKLGAKGAIIHSKDGIYCAKPIKATPLDTTGAGDSFNAGYLSQFLQGSSAEQCAKAAIRVAARSITRVGGVAAFE